MTTLSILLETLTLGLIGGTVPGPILTAVFTEVLSGGLKRSLIVILKALGGAIVLFWLAKQVWGVRVV